MKLYPLDILFSRYIRLRDGGRCRYCGRVGNPRAMHTHHFVGRRYRQTRWEDDNGVCLCFTCHNLMSDFPLINKDFFVKTVGSDRAEQLEIQARSYGKVAKDEIMVRLKEKIKMLENG